MYLVSVTYICGQGVVAYVVVVTIVVKVFVISLPLKWLSQSCCVPANYLWLSLTHFHLQTPHKLRMATPH